MGAFQVTQVVIPAAGLGNRVNHLTKGICKELLPYNGLPLIDHALMEAAKASFEQVIVVSHPSKTPLNRFLERYTKVKIVYQHEQKGLGDAILTSEGLIKRDFCILLPDVVINKQVLPSLMQVCTQLNAPGVAVSPIPKEHVSTHGIIDPIRLKPDYGRIRGIIEKPEYDQAPSNLGIIGRYVVDHGLFDRIRAYPHDKEIELTPCLRPDSVYYLYTGGFVDGGRPDTYGNP